LFLGEYYMITIVTDEEAVNTYSDPNHLQEILAKGTEGKPLLCERFCVNKGKDCCVFARGEVPKEGYCTSFELGETRRPAIEGLLVQTLKTGT
ncbi:MAG TPA: hypothetical protein VGA06_01875, partial [Candidatus Paceibacterota bacterium]